MLSILSATSTMSESFAFWPMSGAVSGVNASGGNTVAPTTLISLTSNSITSTARGTGPRCGAGMLKSNCGSTGGAGAWTLRPGSA